MYTVVGMVIGVLIIERLRARSGYANRGRIDRLQGLRIDRRHRLLHRRRGFVPYRSTVRYYTAVQGSRWSVMQTPKYRSASPVIRGARELWPRSEERRVGKECKTKASTVNYKNHI